MSDFDKSYGGAGMLVTVGTQKADTGEYDHINFSRRFGSVMRYRRKLGEQHAVVSRNGRSRIECTQEDCETSRRCRDSLSSDSAVARAIDAAQGRSADP